MGRMTLNRKMGYTGLGPATQGSVTIFKLLSGPGWPRLLLGWIELLKRAVRADSKRARDRSAPSWFSQFA